MLYPCSFDGGRAPGRKTAGQLLQRRHIGDGRASLGGALGGADFYKIGILALEAGVRSIDIPEPSLLLERPVLRPALDCDRGELIAGAFCEVVRARRAPAYRRIDDHGATFLGKEIEGRSATQATSCFAPC